MGGEGGHIAGVPPPVERAVGVGEAVGVDRVVGRMIWDSMAASLARASRSATSEAEYCSRASAG